MCTSNCFYLCLFFFVSKAASIDSEAINVLKAQNQELTAELEQLREVNESLRAENKRFNDEKNEINKNSLNHIQSKII